MNIAIDVGNTLVKLGVFEENSLVSKKTCLLQDFLSTLTEIGATFKIKYAIIAAVGKLTNNQLKKLEQKYEVVIVSAETKMPFKNRYSTPLTLGVDRLCLVSAAAIQFPEKDVLIIDAGSCITYDFLNSNNEYLGGAISPGLSLRYKSLHTFTAKLPLLEKTDSQQLIGTSTATAIHTGIVKGTLHEIDGFIDSYNEKYPNLTVILTGGDGHFLRDSLKNHIFANSNFLLEGLNYILIHNTPIY